VFDKLDARIAAAMMSIGGVKGVELGDGFAAARMRGSEHNDAIGPGGFESNHAGGIQGGISIGAPIVARLAVKPTASIAKPQRTVDTSGRPRVVRVKGRHDPCLCPRIVPVAEAMMALVLADAWMAQQAVKGRAAVRSPGTPREAPSRRPARRGS
jgi:chorismate synthase